MENNFTNITENAECSSTSRNRISPQKFNTGSWQVNFINNILKPDKKVTDCNLEEKVLAIDERQVGHDQIMDGIQEPSNKKIKIKPTCRKNLKPRKKIKNTE